MFPAIAAGISIRAVSSSISMNDAARGARAKRGKLRIVVAVLAAVLILLIVPPLISIGRYKSGITKAISQAFGRPASLSSVELRLLPWPGFVLTDLTVAEDPAYGAEPVLHANTVTANVRLLPLWRGRLEIGSVDVDEASLNVVRTAPGKWNLDPLFRTAAARTRAAASAHPRRFPYLEATNSRINFKNGAEKLPFSLVNARLSFWQESSGEWRVRLRGQPARTDVVLDLADTGIVRMEASVHSAPELRLMPLRVDLDWRQAQLGQLSRLLLGYDPGWRGDLRGELHIDGTPDAARVTAQLRAAGVRRAEFLPASPLDFDANCSFTYHYSRRALDDLACASPLGNGRVRLIGSVIGYSAPDLTLSLDRIPIAAGLGVLRTLRSGIDPNLEAAGTISGKLIFSRTGSASAAPPRAYGRRVRTRTAAPNPESLSGSLTVENFALSGGNLTQPLRAPRMILEPALPPADLSGPALAGTAAIAAGGAVPLGASVKLARSGYAIALRGQISIALARELAQAVGLPHANVLGNLTGEPLLVNLNAEGPWVPAGSSAVPAAPPLSALAAKAAPPASIPPSAAPDLADTLAGAIVLHDANWHADYLASPLRIAQATLRFNNEALDLDPVAFKFGSVAGTAKVTVPLDCAANAADVPAPTCEPQFAIRFGSLDAAKLDAAFLGARPKGTFLSDWISRFRSTPQPFWPQMEGTVRANSFAIGPVALANASATVKIANHRAEIGDIAGGLLSGKVKASGAVQWGGLNQAVSDFAVTAEFHGLSARATGNLLGARWTGGNLNVEGKIELSGLTGKHLAASANGTLHFDWKHGGVAAQTISARGAAGPEARRGARQVAALPASFTEWSGDAVIGGGAITLGRNQLDARGQRREVAGSVVFGNPPRPHFEMTGAGKPKP